MIGTSFGREAASHQPVAAIAAISSTPNAAAPRRPGSHRSRARHPPPGTSSREP